LFLSTDFSGGDAIDSYGRSDTGTLLLFFLQKNILCLKDYNPQLLTGEESNPTNGRAESSRFDQSGASGSNGGGGGRRSDVPPTNGSGLLQSVEQAGSSLLRAAMSLVPTIRFVPWQPGGRKPPANRRNSGGGDTRWQRTQGRNSVPDTGREGEWKPLVI
jgi:hypothetical protein